MRRLTSLLGLSALLGALVGGVALAVTTPQFTDPLDQPALQSALAPRSPMGALAQAGSHLVAAGSRGHVLRSADGGQNWTQAQVPVSSDLVALHFPDAQHGWAVGHDSVIIATTDGGKTWTRQLDGRSLGERGAENPLLDVWFANAREGYVVGAFGQIRLTRDGGATWTELPAAQSDNPKGLHIYAVRAIAGELYLVGEQGLLLRLDAASGRFVALPMPYQGTLFGITGDTGVLLVHGLRGHALRSEDGGQTWTDVPTGLQVGLTASARTADGAWLLASQAGHLLISRDAGRSFKPLSPKTKPLPAAALIAAGAQGLVIAGPRGLQALALP